MDHLHVFCVFFQTTENSSQGKMFTKFLKPDPGPHEKSILIQIPNEKNSRIHSPDCVVLLGDWIRCDQSYLVDEAGPGGLDPVEEQHHVTVAGVGVPVQVNLAGGAVVAKHILYTPHQNLVLL